LLIRSSGAGLATDPHAIVLDTLAPPIHCLKHKNPQATMSADKIYESTFRCVNDDTKHIEVSDRFELRQELFDALRHRFGDCFVRVWTYRIAAASELPWSHSYKCEIGVYGKRSCLADSLVQMAASSPFCTDVHVAQAEATAKLLWLDALRDRRPEAGDPVFF